MSSHEQFLADVEADLARLTSVLLEVEEEEEEGGLVQDNTVVEQVVSTTTSRVVTESEISNPSSLKEEPESLISNSRSLNDETESKIRNSNAPKGETESETSNSKSLERESEPDHTLTGNISTIGPSEEEMTDLASLDPTEGDMPDLASLLRDHEALLLQIDRVLQKKDVREGEEGDGEYDQFSVQTSELLNDPVEEPEEEEEEEDYFKGMNQFVDSETQVDVERLYDVLEMNLQYQDFISKLNGEVERRLQKNRDKQKQMGEEEDHLFLVSQGLLDKDSRSRALNSKIISLQRFKAPYFSNYYKIGPRLNADQLNLANNPRYQVYMYESGWGKNDRNNLKECLRSSVIEEKMNDVMCGGKRGREEGDLELYHEQLQSSPPEELFSSVDIDSWSPLHWQEVVQSMSSLSAIRSGADCANQWNNYLSPRVTKGEWSAKEDKMLEKLVSQHGTNSWGLVASSLKTGRKGWQCLQRHIKVRKRQFTTWNVSDDKHITDAVMIYGESSFSDLSYYMGDKNSDQCLQRWRYSLRPQIRRGKWTNEEDEEVMNIVSEHGFDWQKIKDVQSHRTRAQVRERVRILTAKDKSGSNGGAKHWSVEETFLLMSLIKKHGAKSWAAIRKDFQLKYTAPVLFRRWDRIQTLLNGSCKRIHLPWERTVMNELLRPKRYLTKALQEELGDMLPGAEEKVKIEEILERCKIHGRTALYKTELKRRIQELTGEEVEEDPPHFLPLIRNKNTNSNHSVHNLLRSNAGNIYKKAFEVGNDAEFKMYYTPPSSTTLSAFSNLLVNHLPNLQEQAGVRPHQQATLPEPLLNSDEFRVLSARFKSLFSWPLIMGETPV